HRWDPAQAGWQRDARFRQAMLYSINREPLAADLQESFTPVVYYPAFLEFPVYQQAIQRGIPRYEYDLTKGQQLFAAAGWNKGPDGLLRNSAGQTVEFPCCRYPTELAANTQESLAWGDYFSTAGLVVENPVVQPPIAGLAAAEQRRVQTVNWGGMKSNWAVTAAGAFQTVIKANIATADTRWVGINTAAWSNPAYDDLYAKASKTLELGPRLETQLQMLKIIMDELPVFPVYYTAIGLVARQGVEGLGQPNPFNRSVVDDVHLWDLTS
ncbi:MAG: hypothetical protein EXR58_00005, partial [Chloroflexi bacterium]|nr:hypothetical protein [Chloroflexota bacterium]